MHSKIIPLLASVSMLMYSAQAHAIRCGTELVSVGDLKYEVYLACGTPVNKDLVGYIDTVKYGERIHAMRIEEWIYRISGNHYSLIFEGNRLKKIESIRTKY